MMNIEINPFEATIKKHLESIASNDSLFAESLKKANKSLKECVNYIYESVRKSGRIGFNDDEVFNMAIHYYDEDDIKGIKPTNCNVVVNHTDFEGKKVASLQKEKPKKEVKSKVTENKHIEQLTMF